MYVPFYEGQRHYNSEMTRLANLIQEELSYIGIGRNISGGITKRNIDQTPKYQYLLGGQVVQADYYADIRHAMKGDTLDYGPDLNTETGVPTILEEHCFRFRYRFKKNCTSRYKCNKEVFGNNKIKVE